MISFSLPWPPSVNHYWRSIITGRRVKVIVCKKGREYRAKVCGILGPREPLMRKLAVLIVAYYPDNRKRDLDNLPKAILDSLTEANVWEDDSQIEALSLYRGENEKGGRIEIYIEVIEQAYFKAFAKKYWKLLVEIFRKGTKE